MAEQDYVKMMRESLEKKVAILQEIQKKNQEQERILNNPNATPDEFENNIDTKAALVDQIVALDNGFQTLYERVREALNQNRSQYADEIATMKECIRSITEYSAAVQVQEKQNYLLAQKKFAYVKDKVRGIRKSQQVVNSYYQNMMQSKFVDPQFMDRKN